MCDELLKAIARWLVATGFGVDYNCSEPPPVALRPFLVQAWLNDIGDLSLSPNDIAWMLNTEAGEEWYS